MKQSRLGLFVAAVYALSAGCSGTSEVSGGIDLIHIDQPDWYIWYQSAIVATFLYLPIAPILAVRAADARAVAALPLVGSTALTSFSLLKGLEVLSAIGPDYGRGTVAALLAETIFPWSIGTAVSAATSVAIGVVAAKSGTLPRSTPSGSIALVVSAGVSICTAGFMLYVWTTVGKDAALSESAASVLFGFSILTLGAAAVSAFWLQARMTRPVSRRWFWLFALFCTVASILVFLNSGKLTAVAAAGG